MGTRQQIKETKASPRFKDAVELYEQRDALEAEKLSSRARIKAYTRAAKRMQKHLAMHGKTVRAKAQLASCKDDLERQREENRAVEERVKQSHEDAKILDERVRNNVKKCEEHERTLRKLLSKVLSLEEAMKTSLGYNPSNFDEDAPGAAGEPLESEMENHLTLFQNVLTGCGEGMGFIGQLESL